MHYQIHLPVYYKEKKNQPSKPLENSAQISDQQ